MLDVGPLNILNLTETFLTYALISKTYPYPNPSDVYAIFMWHREVDFPDVINGRCKQDNIGYSLR